MEDDDVAEDEVEEHDVEDDDVKREEDDDVESDDAEKEEDVWYCMVFFGIVWYSMYAIIICILVRTYKHGIWM